MTINRIIGAVVLVVGIILLGFAIHSTNAPLEDLSEAITGRYSDKTMWYFIVGTAAAVGGALLVVMGRQK